MEQQFRGAAVLLHKMGYLPPGFRQLWSNQRLLNVVEQFIGPDIGGEQISSNSVLVSGFPTSNLGPVSVMIDFRPSSRDQHGQE